MAKKSPVPFLLAMLLLATAVLRWRFLDIPLERDEGEFAYGGQLILAGEVPYASMYAMKLPGIYLVYALFEALFGQSARGIHLGLLVVNLSSIALVFAVAQRLFDAWTSLLSATIFAVLTFSAAVVGTLAQAEHFVLLPTLAGALVLLKAEDRPTWWAYLTSGLMFGTALLMKQHGGTYLLFGLLFASTSDRSRWGREWRKRLGELTLLTIGGAIPLAIVSLAIALLGAWDPFLFWTFTYAREYVREEPLADAWANFSLAFSFLWQFWSVWWVLGAIGLVAVAVLPWWRASRRFLLLWLAASCLAVVPGFYFRHHYFLFLTPSLAMFSAAALQTIRRALAGQSRWSRPLAAALTVGVLAWPIYSELSFALPKSPRELSRAYYPNVFADAPQIARIVAENSGPGDRVAILGSEPELLFYSQRRSATGHVYLYPLMEPQPFALEMQREAIGEIEAARPEIFVICEFRDSWGDTPDSHLEILHWSRRYVAENYDQIARIDLMEHRPAKFRVTPGELAAPPESSSLVYVLRRKKPAND